METEKYVFMHRDDEVALLEFNQTDGYLLRVLEKKNEELVPYRANLSTQDFVAWWRDRAVPKTQGSILSFLREYNIPTTQSYLLRNLGLSLNDHYWVKPIGSNLTWDAVNLFTNDFADSLSVMHILSGNYSGVSSFSPSASTGGDLPKKWVIKEGKRYLIKESAGLSIQQSLNEIFATRLHESQKRMPYVSYSLVEEGESQKIACSCECFTSDTREFIPAWDLVGRETLAKDEPLFEDFVTRCVVGGLQEDAVRAFLDYQIVTDFLISNVDRHLNNFGVLRDTHTLDFVSMAPIFDSGNSMFYLHPPMAKATADLLKIKTHGFFSSERRHIEHVRDFGCVDLSAVPGKEEAERLYAQDKVLHDTGYDRMIAFGYEQKTAFLREMQRGTSFGKLLEKEISQSMIKFR